MNDSNTLLAMRDRYWEFSDKRDRSNFSQKKIAKDNVLPLLFFSRIITANSAKKEHLPPQMSQAFRAKKT